VGVVGDVARTAGGVQTEVVLVAQEIERPKSKKDQQHNLHSLASQDVVGQR
jgi:hypothetical protein